MTKKIAYERKGKFGNEYLIPLNILHLIPSKETEKALACGEYEGVYKDGNPKYIIFGWIPKSMIVEIEGEKFIPAWIVDKWNFIDLQYTRWINEDFWKSDDNKSWEVREI